MNLVYGALLLHSAGKEINEESMKKIADATGENIEESQIKALIAALDGVNIEEAMSKAVATPVAAPVESGAKEEKKEEKNPEEEEKKEESAAEGLGALFG